MKKMNKKGILIGAIVLIGILLLILFILIIELFVQSTPMHKNYQKFLNNFDLELKGQITDIKSDGALRIACLKVEESNYKEYRMESNRFFIRVDDSLAVMIYSVKSGNKYKYHTYKIGSQLLINHNNNKQVIELEGTDTINKYPIVTYPTRDYLKNSCIPD